MQPKHSAIVAGLTLALSFGAVTAPAPAAAEEPTPGVASDATDIDKGLYTQQSFSGVLRSVQGVSFVNVTPEMKYFTKYESHGNYNQGFSYGDGYNALGYYQFDRRWSLIPFMKQAYNYNPEKYSMLKDAIDRGSEISNTSNAMYENGQLTELGRIAQEAFQGAYNTDPVEFSALQDAYAYNSYYAVTEAWLKSGLGIDISGRADCVKGMVWSITNMCGTGGCRDFFRWANLSNDMSDREFVTALSNSVVNNVATKYSSQPQYHEGWKNRYRNELKDCLVYIAEDEAAAAAGRAEEMPILRRKQVGGDRGRVRGNPCGRHQKRRQHHRRHGAPRGGIRHRDGRAGAAGGGDHRRADEGAVLQARHLPGHPAEERERVRQVLGRQRY